MKRRHDPAGLNHSGYNALSVRDEILGNCGWAPQLLKARGRDAVVSDKCGSVPSVTVGPTLPGTPAADG